MWDVKSGMVVGEREGEFGADVSSSSLPRLQFLRRAPPRLG
jgi:hypothetical protein